MRDRTSGEILGHRFRARSPGAPAVSATSRGTVPNRRHLSDPVRRRARDHFDVHALAPRRGRLTSDLQWLGRRRDQRLETQSAWRRHPLAAVSELGGRARSSCAYATGDRPAVCRRSRVPRRDHRLSRSPKLCRVVDCELGTARRGVRHLPGGAGGPDCLGWSELAIEGWGLLASRWRCIRRRGWRVLRPRRAVQPLAAACGKFQTLVGRGQLLTFASPRDSPTDDERALLLAGLFELCVARSEDSVLDRVTAPRSSSAATLTRCFFRRDRWFSACCSFLARNCDPRFEGDARLHPFVDRVADDPVRQHVFDRAAVELAFLRAMQHEWVPLHQTRTLTSESIARSC